MKTIYVNVNNPADLRAARLECRKIGLRKQAAGQTLEITDPGFIVEVAASDAAQQAGNSLQIHFIKGVA